MNTSQYPRSTRDAANLLMSIQVTAATEVYLNAGCFTELTAARAAAAAELLGHRIDQAPVASPTELAAMPYAHLSALAPAEQDRVMSQWLTGRCPLTTLMTTLGPAAAYLRARSLWLRCAVSLLALVLTDHTSWQFAPPQLLGDIGLSLALTVLAAVFATLPLLVIADTSPISLERDSAAPMRRRAFGIGAIAVTVIAISTYCGFVFFSGAARGHDTWWAFPIASWRYRPATAAAMALCVAGLLLLLRDPGRVER